MSALRHAVASPSLPDIIEWLVGDACHELDDAGLIAGLGRRLREAGLPIDRLTLLMRTLHPEILGRVVAWAPNEPVEIYDREHGIELSVGFAGSPLQHAMETQEQVSLHSSDPYGAAWTALGAFKGRGLLALFVAPLHDAAGPDSAVTFGTARPGGFAAGERAALGRIVPPLRTACELRFLRRIEQTLLDADEERIISVRAAATDRT